MIRECPWEQLEAFVANGNLSSALAKLPSFVITRGDLVYKPRLRFASARLGEMFFEHVPPRRKNWLLQQFWVLRNNPDTPSWPYFERLAGSIITGSIGCQTRWARMETEVITSADKAFVEDRAGGQQEFHSRVLASANAPIQMEQFDSETIARRPNSPLKRSRSSTSPSQEPVAKRSKTEREATEPSTDHQEESRGGSAEPAAPEPGIPSFPRKVPEGPLTKDTPHPLPLNIYFTAANKMFPLVDAAIHFPNHGVVFQIFDKKGEGRHRMAISGIPQVRQMFAKDLPIVFVAVIPKGNNARLMVPAGAFTDWLFYSLELDIPSANIS
ncbi:hypothetical protein FB451DRAFT_309510 [Mycena latifolia]|nr:hypothetical protein FB451DRAFT_309510 [Mycena latifolia]